MKKILITCDTEVGELALGQDAVEIFMEGKVENRRVGLDLINTIASKNHAIVEHFIDIFPYERYGEDKFRGICNRILQVGHSLQLHTHPSGNFDSARKYMHEYSLQEQSDIIEWGKSKIRNWTGYEVIAHRAGGYGANNDTLEALSRHGIGIDSSFFYKNPACQLSYNQVNGSGRYHNIFEIPVTVYECEKRLLPFYTSRTDFIKLDFRYGSSVEDILNVIKAAPENSIIVLFLHSFNFLDLKYNIRRKSYTRVSVNDALIRQFEILLERASSLKGAQFSRFSDIDTNSRTNEICIKLRKTELMGKSFFQRIKRKVTATIEV